MGALQEILVGTASGQIFFFLLWHRASSDPARRFLFKQNADPDEAPALPSSSILPSNPPPPLISSVDSNIVESSESQKLFQQTLRNIYEPLETFFLRNTTDKALRLSVPDTSSRPHLSSAPDDTFYLLKSVMYRLVAGSNVDMLERMVGRVAEVVEVDFLGGIKRKMDGVYAGVRSAGGGSAARGEGGGGGPKAGSEAERLEKEMRGLFVVRFLSFVLREREVL